MSIAAFEGQREKKFFKKYKEGLPCDPWAHMSNGEIIARLDEEVQELKEALESGSDKDIQGETLDIANFSWILWERIEHLKQSKN